jgi:hypothetical protein
VADALHTLDYFAEREPPDELPRWIGVLIVAGVFASMIFSAIVVVKFCLLLVRAD